MKHLNKKAGLKDFFTQDDIERITKESYNKAIDAINQISQFVEDKENMDKINEIKKSLKEVSKNILEA